MKKWQKEIDYIYNNLIVDRYDTDSPYDVRVRFEFDYYSTISSAFNYFFIILNYGDAIFFFIHYDKDKTQVNCRNINYSLENEREFVDKVVNYFARKMYYDDLLNIEFP